MGALEYVPEPPSTGLFGGGNRGGGGGGGDGAAAAAAGRGGVIGMETGDEDADGDGDGDVSSELIEFHEWVGVVSCGCAGEILREETLQGSNKQRKQKTASEPPPEETRGGVGGDGGVGANLETHRWEGLLLPSHAERALDFCRDVVDAGGGTSTDSPPTVKAAAALTRHTHCFKGYGPLTTII